jgi:hypothetical protein
LRSSAGVKLAVSGGFFILDRSLSDESENTVNHGGH